MLKSLLLFIVLILVFFIAIIGIVVFKAMALVRSLKKGGKGKKQTSGYSNGSYQSHRTTNTSTGETIIDTRDPQTANRKIIPSDEGEYVDYTIE